MLLLPAAIHNAMLAHALRELPNECCGLLAGMGESVTEHYSLVNVLVSPTEFESEPRSLLAAHKAMRASGTDILAIYHSHPSSEPIPSRRDRERNYSEAVVNLIIGLNGPTPVVRGWYLTADGAREAEWAII